MIPADLVWMFGLENVENQDAGVVTGDCILYGHLSPTMPATPHHRHEVFVATDFKLLWTIVWGISHSLANHFILPDGNFQ